VELLRYATYYCQAFVQGLQLGVTEIRHLLLPGFCAGLTTFSAVTAQSLEPKDGGMLFLLHNLIFSLMIIVIVLPLARRVIPVRS